MYPRQVIVDLDRRKARLRERIASRRADCAAATNRILEPLVEVERWWRAWRQASPFIKFGAIPIVGVVVRLFASRMKSWGRWLRWLPIATAAWKAFRGAGKGNGFGAPFASG